MPWLARSICVALRVEVGALEATDVWIEAVCAALDEVRGTLVAVGGTAVAIGAMQALCERSSSPLHDPSMNVRAPPAAFVPWAYSS